MDRIIVAQPQAAAGWRTGRYAMKCWVCKRQARGYGHTDGRYKSGDPQRYPVDWVFVLAVVGCISCAVRQLATREGRARHGQGGRHD